MKADSKYQEIEEWYDRWADKLYHYLKTLLNNPDLAEEALQTVFLKLVKQSEAAKQAESPGAYLFTMARNVAINLKRRSSVEKKSLSEIGAGVRRLYVNASSREELEQVEKLLAGLPAEQCEIVVLKIYEELTFSEIAEVLGLPPNTVASRYRYAMEKIRTVLEASDGR